MKAKEPNNEKILSLINEENVNYSDINNHTTLMYAFKYYGRNPNCDSKVFLKLLDMNCVPEQVDDEDGYTDLMYAL